MNKNLYLVIFLFLAIFSRQSLATGALSTGCTKGLASISIESPAGRNTNLAFNDSGAVVYKGSTIKRLKKEDVERTIEIDGKIESADTIRIVSKAGRFQNDSVASVLILHGNGTVNSQAGGMVPIMATMSSRKTGGKGVNRALSDRGLKLPLDAMAIDQPGHGAGPSAKQFSKLSRTVEWTAKELQEMRDQGKPVFVVAKSGSAGVIAEVVNKYPNLVDGIILIGPQHPVDLAHANKEFAKVRSNPESARMINEEGYEWAVSMYSQMTWQLKARPFDNVPVLTLIGSKDYETSEKGRQIWRDVEKTNPNLTYKEIDGAYHDVTAQRFRGEGLDAQAEAAYIAIYQFISNNLARN